VEIVSHQKQNFNHRGVRGRSGKLSSLQGSRIEKKTGGLNGEGKKEYAISVGERDALENNILQSEEEQGKRAGASITGKQGGEGNRELRSEKGRRRTINTPEKVVQ